MIRFPKKVLEKVQKYLEREKKKVKGQIFSLSKEDPFADPDRLMDNAASDTEAKEEVGHQRIESIKKTLAFSLERIERALQRIGRRTYGQCETCKKLIDTDRLAANPTATLCIECKKRLEKVKKG